MILSYQIKDVMNSYLFIELNSQSNIEVVLTSESRGISKCDSREGVWHEDDFVLKQFKDHNTDNYEYLSPYVVEYGE